MDLLVTSTQTFSEFIGNENNILVMLSYFRRKSNPNYAEYILKNACIKLSRNWNTIRQHPKPLGYIYKTLKNAVTDFWREEEKQRGPDTQSESGLTREFEAKADQYIREAFEDLILEAKDELDRQILAYRYAGYKHREIANRVKKPKATIESRIQRLWIRLGNKRL